MLLSFVAIDDSRPCSYNTAHLVCDMCNRFCRFRSTESEADFNIL